MPIRECLQTTVVIAENEGTVKTRAGRNVPGMACQRACFEGPDIVDEIVNDHFHKFLGEGVGTLDGSRCVFNWVRMKYMAGPGLAVVPGDASREAQPFVT